MTRDQAEMVGPDMGMLTEACALTTTRTTISATVVQRRLRVGFAKAGRLLILMEDIGVVGPWGTGGQRKVLASAADLDRILAVPS